MSDKDERAQRLAAQLRANLRRRKVQAREVAAAAATGDETANGVPGTGVASDG